MKSRYFIKIDDENDFWTALRDGTAILSRTKPLPHKNWRRLTNEEDAIYGCRDQTMIILFDQNKTIEERRLLLEKSMANIVCENFPDLAKKHTLSIDRKHEFWRNQ